MMSRVKHDNLVKVCFRKKFYLLDIGENVVPQKTSFMHFL